MRGLAFMPLEVGRLLDSDLFALSTGEEFKAAVALWCKCWTQVPAGSLPDDDRVLAHLSGTGIRWKKLKAMALRNFILCDDGRLYHDLIAEKVNEAWLMRLRQRERSAKGNAKRWGGDNPPNPYGDDYGPHGDPRGDARCDPKGQGQGHIDTHNSASINSNLLSVPNERTVVKSEKPKRFQYPADFLVLWNGYPTDPNMSKREAYDVWRKLPLEERDEAIKALPAFRLYCEKNKDHYRPIHVCRFLSKRRAEGFVASADKVAAAGPSVFVKVNTPPWEAWRKWYMATKGSTPPQNREGGWHFPSEWPPQEVEAA